MKELVLIPKIVTGIDSLDYLKTIQAKHVFIVTDQFISNSGILAETLTYLEGNSVEVFADVSPDPPIANIMAGIHALEQHPSEVVIALGGGSPIDAAKGIIYFATKAHDHLNRKNIEFIVIPTTSGTGSEVTNFSVITDEDTSVKYPLVTNDILPDVAILYTPFVQGLPKKQTADTGVDVLTHALEAYVSTSANDLSDALAERAIQLVFTYLPRAYKNGETDVEARDKMHLASTIAGIAFNIASLGINHSLAHALGAKTHIAHGRINGILLNPVIAYNAERNDANAAEKYKKIAALLGVKINNTKLAITQLNKKISDLLRVLEMPTTLTAAGCDSSVVSEQIQAIAESALHDRCTPTNPRHPEVKELEQIIASVI